MGKMSTEENRERHQHVLNMKVGDSLDYAGIEYFSITRKDETDKRYLACNFCKERSGYIGRVVPVLREKAPLIRRLVVTGRALKVVVSHIKCIWELEKENNK